MVSIAVSASNSNMIHANFLDRIEGGKPSYYPLVFHCEDKIRNMIMAMDSAVNFGIPDIVVLGMGGDGHFASLFPNDTSSNLGLDIQFPNPILYTIAPVQPNFRISYSWSQLRKARFHFIHITGDSKWEVIAQHSTRQNDLPIDVVLRDQQINPVLYWAS
jgi:6-phosphogluconolactonase/glucosamine-6-phosphate isomerase/deaminase